MSLSNSIGKYKMSFNFSRLSATFDLYCFKATNYDRARLTNDMAMIEIIIIKRSDAG